MYIIFEGCDCVGKTTIINVLNKLLYNNFEIVKFSAPTSSAAARFDYEKTITKMQKEDRNIIFDRAFLGECVYAPIYRNYYPYYMRELEKYIPENTLLVLLIANIETLKKRFDGEFIEESDIPNIQKKYLEEFKKANYKNKIILDTSVASPKETANKIIKYLEEKM